MIHMIDEMRERVEMIEGWMINIWLLICCSFRGFAIFVFLGQIMFEKDIVMIFIILQFLA